MSETSTIRALSPFPGHDPVEVTEFGASDQTTQSWLTAAQLPHLQNVRALSAFLADHESLDLVDVSIRVGTGAEISTHDDGEATFTVSSDEVALHLLARALPAPEAVVIGAVLASHRGHYVSLGPAGIQVFKTFGDYLQSRA